MENSQHISPSKIQALIRLLEDPDPNIHNVVKAKLVSYGKDALPHIEHSWHTDIHDHEHQERTVEVLRHIQIDDLKIKLQKWKDSSTRDLLEGTLIISQFQFPDIDLMEIESEIDLSLIHI